MPNHLSRRKFVQLATLYGLGCSLANIGDARAEAESGIAVPLFDGKTLDGWIQIENNAISLSVDGITDPSAFAGKLANGTDAVSVFLRGKLDALVNADLVSYSLTQMQRH